MLKTKYTIYSVLNTNLTYKIDREYILHFISLELNTHLSIKRVGLKFKTTGEIFLELPHVCDRVLLSLVVLHLLQLVPG